MIFLERIKKIRLAAALLSTVLILQGCGNSVDCNDSKTKESAIEIIQSNLAKVGWYEEMSAAIAGSPKLSNVSTVSHDETANRSECRASYSLTYNGRPRELPVTYYLSYLQDKGSTDVRVAVAQLASDLLGLAGSEPPIKNGLEKTYDLKSGNLQSTTEWKNGVLNGTEKIYDPHTTELTNEINWDMGKKDGTEKGWSKDGATLLIDLTWKDGKPTGFQKSFDDVDGKPLIDVVFKDGVVSGFETKGTHEISYDEFNYKNGVLDGIHNHYEQRISPPYGRYLQLSENYKDNKLDGIQQTFAEDGSVKSHKLYKDGVETTDGTNSDAGPNATVEFASKSSTTSSEVIGSCVDSKIAAFHKSDGDDALISDDMQKEWVQSCSDQAVAKAVGRQ
jgi:antitoxin component YwqK of YwqJK toxin-antitoxin module